VTTSDEKQESGAPRILIGTSGFGYAEWRGSFYPEDLSSKKFLSYYAQHFKTTEINNTFYRLPTAKLTSSWCAEVPADFSFTLKLSQKITHIKRLRNVDEEMGVFLSAAGELKEKLGPILVQLPPNFRKDVAVLDQFLDQFSTKARLALEFRHESWFGDDVYQALSTHNCALGVVEAEMSTPRVVTGPLVYMRLRKGDYSDAELDEWARWIRAQTVDVYCYLKHDELSPVLAKRLIESLDRV
jgi:uncharacterized protein YecE (DUF72 family)